MPAQRAPFAPLAVDTALAGLGHQSCPLQGQLYPGIAQMDPVLAAELLVKMAHVQVKVLLPVKPQHLLGLPQWHAFGLAGRAADQSVVALFFIALANAASVGR